MASSVNPALAIAFALVFTAFGLYYFSSTPRVGPTFLLNNNDDNNNSPDCANQFGRSRLCECMAPFSVDVWRSILVECGVNDTAVLLAKTLSNRAFNDEDQMFMEEFHRPLVFLYPSLFSQPQKQSLSSPSSSSSSRLFFREDEMNEEHADSGHCWYFEEIGVFKCLPSLLIIGFQRAATRELYNWIIQNPNVRGYGSKFTRARGNQHMSVESHYFDSLNESQSYHGLQPIRRPKPLGSLEDTWAKVYLDASPNFTIDEVLLSNFVFEKTPAYADETDPKTIRKLLPSVKMIVAVREPSSRLWSGYWRRCDALQRIDCSTQDFVRTILEPAERCGLPDRTFVNEADFKKVERHCLPEFDSGFYLRAVLVGHYSLFLQRYVDTFNATKATMLLVFAESFASSPFKVMKEIEQYMDVAPFDYEHTAYMEEKTQLYVVSDTSKALKEKPEGYIKFEEVPLTIRDRIARLYGKATLVLKQYLNKQSTTEQKPFMHVSKHLPGWFSRL